MFSQRPTILFVLFLSLTLTTSGQIQTSHNDYFTVESVLAKANKNILPDEFTMIYNDRQGQAFFVQWKKDVRDWLPDHVKVVSDEGISEVKLQKPRRYSGYIMKTDRSIATLLAFNDHSELMLASEGTGNVFVSKHLGQQVRYAQEKPFLEDHIQRTTCSPDLKHIDDNINALRSGDPSCKKIYLSITADYDLYEKKSRQVVQVTNYIAGVMNNVQEIYNLEEINLGIEEIIIHQSPDALRHLTALDDLNIFRFIRSSFNGHIALCLSGYTDIYGMAPLGGHAFINALCNRSFAYAYVNVDGSYSSFPDYSWDIFGVTHEIGHVIGSPHTHSCSWGPNGNETLDDCSTPEGACAPGPTVTEGTIMSYCHLPGGPGIHFAAGFGDEPGDLIRSKVASSTCLDEYIPEKVQPRNTRSYTANRSCHDGNFTHYYFDNNTIDEGDDILLLSIDKNGEDIGSLDDGSLVIRSKYGQNVTRNRATHITAPYVPHGTDYYVMNKYWNIQSTRSINSDITIRLPYCQEDFDDLDLSIPSTLQMSDVKSFVITSPGTANPDLNHRNTTTSLYTELDMGATASRSTWRHTLKGNTHYAEFKTRTLHEYGLGAYGLPALPVELISFKGVRQNDDVHIRWTVANEVNLAEYEIERSYDGVNFEKASSVTPSSLPTYKWIDKGHTHPAYYRLKMTDIDLSRDHSHVIYVDGLAVSGNVGIMTNPVSTGELLIRSSDPDMPLQLSVISTLGQVVKTSDLIGQNHYKVGVRDLPDGYYVVRITGSNATCQETLIIAND